MIDSFILSMFFFIAYMGIIIRVFGIPVSLSETYYILKEAKNTIVSSLFTLFCLAVSLTLIYPWIELTGVFYPEITFLPFLACGGFAFVGVASAFKETMTRTVHYCGAGLCAGCSLTWSFLMGQWISQTICFGIFIVLMLFRSQRKNYLFWVEMVAFISTFINIGICLFKLLS